MVATPPPARPTLPAPSGHGTTLRLAQLGIVVNALLAVVKLVAGVVGNAFVLVADAVESATDIFGSVVVWSGLRIASRDPDDLYPWGYGRAEALAGAVVAVLMLGAAAGISIEAVWEIRTPHTAPAAWTLGVLAVVIVVKELLAKRGMAASEATGSVAGAADAWHHRSDAITSAAAFVGISVALVGGKGWEAADDWGALVAAGVITWNGGLLLRTALSELMDRAPDGTVLQRVAQAALAIGEVRAIEKLKVRKSGSAFYVDIHVQADPGMSLHEAHLLSGRVKGAIRDCLPAAAGVLIHMEPFDAVRPIATPEAATAAGTTA